MMSSDPPDYEEFLNGHGYTVKLYEDGAAALSAFETCSDEVDLVITDMTMPAVTGTNWQNRC